MIELSMQPRTIPVPWKVFRTTAVPFSLAIDGFVPEGPEFDPTIPVMNLNHHDGVKRIETRYLCTSRNASGAEALSHVQRQAWSAHDRLRQRLRRGRLHELVSA